MGQVRDFAERLLAGTASTRENNPLTTFLGLEEYAPGVAFVSSLANVLAVTTSEGLVLVDTGAVLTGEAIRAQIRAWSIEPVRAAVYTHGHADHAMGIFAFDREAKERGARAIEVFGHEAVAARFDRYRRTAGLNGRINARQFRMPGLAWPTEYRYPDRTFRDGLDLEIGGVRFEIHHARGETDDHAWLWLPATRALCTGDLFIWAAPNCGNPQKVQRYPREWAVALREMATLAPVVLFPGHGPPIEGEARVRDALGDTAALLEHLHDETLRRMNDGASLDAILAEVRAPEALLARPWLHPVYDDPEFVVRNVWRLYGGWWDGDPARLRPARDAAIAAEVASLAGGATALATRAEAVAAAGDLPLACQLVEWASRAAPDDAGVRAVRHKLYRARADAEPSLMAKSVFREAAER